ncbi:uncharacterized protein [Aristolochia californica]|uniref:uncharacterized protein isoform X2 n=1 Tax=Aristolochia californica TaxID=171875 RepID=UPI0035D5CA29
MGREWYWSSGSRSMRRSSGEKESQLGCISTVLHFFDFQKFQCASSQQHEQQPHRPLEQDRDTNKDYHTPPKGVEAPRNSLELQEGPSSSSSSAILKEEEDDIPFSVQLLPLKSSSSSEREVNDVQRLPFSDDVYSRGSKTPNLVARLMGLDLLPEEISSATSSPSYRRSTRKHRQPHQSFQYKNNFTCSRYESGSRSLPDTPRISMTRRSDVDSRLSLQHNKENTDVPEFNYRRVSREAPSSSSPFSLRRSGSRRDAKLKPYEESKSPSKYAREIVKQAKENVSRRVGADITNITAGGSNKDNEGQSKQSTPSRSPRLRVPKQKTGSVIPENYNIHSAFKSLRRPQAPQQPEPVNGTSKPKGTTTQRFPQPKPTTKCKKALCERFTRKPRKPPSSETFESLATEVLPKYKVQGGVGSNQEPPKTLGVRDDSTGESEFRYVSVILEGTGSKWYSPSHPLDPSLFHDLEYHDNHYTPTVGPVNLKSYRKLLFHLSDEILAQLLKPCLRTHMAAAGVADLTGTNLLKMLWARMNNYPEANCKTLQDIDALVGLDVPDTPLCVGALEEWELVVFEIEREIVESLVAEAAVGLRTETTQ